MSGEIPTDEEKAQKLLEQLIITGEGLRKYETGVAGLDFEKINRGQILAMQLMIQGIRGSIEKILELYPGLRFEDIPRD